MRRLKKRDIARIVYGRFDRLFECAEYEVLQGDMKFANRYAELARKLGMRYNISIPRKYKLRFCKHCHTYLTAENSRVRTHDSRLVISCKNCSGIRRMPFVREKRARRE